MEWEAEAKKLTGTINDLRYQLAKRKWAFGALFVGHTGGVRGFIFSEDMPHEMRMGMLDEMQQALDAARKRFQQ